MFNQIWTRPLATMVAKTASIVVGTTVNDGESPTGSTKLDDETGHNCKMPHDLYRIFCTSVLGLPSDSWAIT